MRIKKLLIIFSCSFALVGCNNEQNSTQKVDGVENQEVKETVKVNSNGLITIMNEEDIKYFQEAFNKAVKVAGIADMATPQYKIKLGKNGDVYFLWFDDKMETGTIMNAEDTHTIYTISYTEKIKEIIK